MKEVVIKGAEVVPFYGTNETTKEHSTDKGTVINFNVKTKINDRNEKSPHLFEKCHIWLKSQEDVDTIKGYLRAGNIIQVTGTEDQSKFKDKTTGKDVYQRTVRVNTITPIVVDNQDAPEETNVDDDLPF